MNSFRTFMNESSFSDAGVQMGATIAADGLPDLTFLSKELMSLTSQQPTPKSPEEVEAAKKEVTPEKVKTTIDRLNDAVHIVRTIDGYLIGAEKTAKLAGYALPRTLIDFLQSTIALLGKMRSLDKEEKKAATRSWVEELKNVAKLLPGSFLTGLTLWILIPLIHMAPFLFIILIANKIVYWIAWYTMLFASKLQKAGEPEQKPPVWKRAAKGAAGFFKGILPKRYGDVMFHDEEGEKNHENFNWVMEAYNYDMQQMFGIALNESTIPELYQSTVDAFTNTTLRQHATHPVVIKNLHWTPFKGMRTLFVKGLAQNEGREYNPIILFKGVKYDEGGLRLMANNGEEYEMAPMDMNETEVVVRCNCPDFHWRFNYYNHLDKSLYGRKRAKYESKGERGPSNPMEMPGMCKHCLKLAEVLRQAGVFQE